MASGQLVLRGDRLKLLTQLMKVFLQELRRQQIKTLMLLLKQRGKPLKEDLGQE